MQAMRPVAGAASSSLSRQLKVTLAPAKQGLYRFRLYSSETAEASTSSRTAAPPAWEIRMLYDGACPLCMREVRFLQDRDAGKGKIDFVDIAGPSYDPADNANISYEQAMGRIHALLRDGKVITDVEVFRRLYEAVGLGWVYAITKVEPIGKLADSLYSVWAKYRTQLTGRESMEVILEKYKAGKTTCRDA